MTQVFQYRTIKTSVQGGYKQKGSKFTAYAYPIQSTNEYVALLKALQKEHCHARHICWAYAVEADSSLYRVNDDGEPFGSAGLPIYRQICSHQLTYIFVAVVRYFGGTLLGVGGLRTAYKEAVSDAFSYAEMKVLGCYIFRYYFMYDFHSPIPNTIFQKKINTARYIMLNRVFIT